MEKLNYIIEDSTIAELLGNQNFNNSESALLELVKNSYDAGATELSIEFSDDCILIKDNGKGMSSDDIKKHWMHVGLSSKANQYCIQDSNKNTRILSGSKGVGRFALAKLGNNISLFSYKDGVGIEWTTNWNESFLNKSDHLNKNGTEIIITELRQRWDVIQINNVYDFIERAYNDDTMEITIKYIDGQIRKVNRIFNNLKIGINYLSNIHLDYSLGRLVVHINSDEFNNSFFEHIKSNNTEFLDIHNYENDINILEEIKLNNRLDKITVYRNDADLIDILNGIGQFSADFYFNMGGISTDDFEKFCYKHKELPEKIKSGIVLYRNAFSISSFDGSKDWLELGKRSRKSPAAASHPTGTWRVRENQLSGIVRIDKIENKNIIDLSNRQGVEENIYYKIFKLILQIGISEFERYRQKLIRNISVNNEIKEEKPKQIKLFLENPNSVKNFSSEELQTMVTEIKQINQDKNDLVKTKVETEKQYKYDIRILNALSTIGLRASSMAHEFKNDKNNLPKYVDYIINALKNYELWDLLNDIDHTDSIEMNIPNMLEKMQKVNIKISKFINTLLTEAEKEQFEFKELNINEILKKIKKNWEADYSWIKINIDCPNFSFYLSNDILSTIFDNLILNSIQQNSGRNSLDISINALLEDGNLSFKYKDNGMGLNETYSKDPFRILEVHETSRKNGHGLGMWIVNNSVKMTNGEIKRIYSDNGFGIEFYLGGKY